MVELSREGNLTLYIYDEQLESTIYYSTPIGNQLLNFQWSFWSPDPQVIKKYEHTPTISALSPSFEMDHQSGNYSGLETQTWITSSTAPPLFRYFPRSHLSKACFLTSFTVSLCLTTLLGSAWRDWGLCKAASQGLRVLGWLQWWIFLLMVGAGFGLAWYFLCE